MMSYCNANMMGRGRSCEELGLTVLFRLSILTVAAASVMGLSACSSRNADGRLQGAALPDEFRVISQKPLVIPPDYGLRPPTPGKPSPQELQPESAARTALLGQQYDPNASQGERLFLAKAGVDAANGNIKAVVDDEFGDIAHKSKSFADVVMFWRKDKPETQIALNPGKAGTNTPTPLDPALEKKRIDALTGGQDVSIVRTPPPAEKRKFKLPGL